MNAYFAALYFSPCYLLLFFLGLLLYPLRLVPCRHCLKPATFSLLTAWLVAIGSGNLKAQDYPQGREPIQGELQRDIAPGTNGNAPYRGQLQVYQILRVQIGQAQLYQAIELELSPWDNTNDSTANTANDYDNGQNGQPVSLLVYNQLSPLNSEPARDDTEQDDKPKYQGRRLLTRGIVGKTLLRFTLSDEISGYNPSRQPSLEPKRQQASQNISVKVTQFPIYIVLYPFQTVEQALIAKTSETSAQLGLPSYQYSLRYLRKKFGLIRIRLLPPKTSKDSEHNPTTNYLDDSELYLSLQIDERNHDWIFDPDYVETSTDAPYDPGSGHTHTADSLGSSRARYSQPYRLGLGRHNIQVISPKYYTRAQFQLEAGETKILELQLQERLSQLRLVLPKNSVVLLDGIPLQSRQRSTPSWQDVEIRELESYHYEQTRLQYLLSVPAGKHHLLIQYEGNTWQRQIFFQEGVEQYFQLNWELSSQINPQN